MKRFAKILPFLALVLASFWKNYVQRTMAYMIGTLTSIDVTGNADSIKELIGSKGYSFLILALAVVVAIRAHSKPSAPPLPPPTPP